MVWNEYERKKMNLLCIWRRNFNLKAQTEYHTYTFCLSAIFHLHLIIYAKPVGHTYVYETKTVFETFSTSRPSNLLPPLFSRKCGYTYECASRCIMRQKFVGLFQDRILDKNQITAKLCPKMKFYLVRKEMCTNSNNSHKIASLRRHTLLTTIFNRI